VLGLINNISLFNINYQSLNFIELFKIIYIVEEKYYINIFYIGYVAAIKAA
jgi:hypothetical protein